MRPVLPASSCCVALALAAAPGRAQTALLPETVRLEYTSPSEAAGCPDEPYFRNFVAARLGGHDPFTAGAARQISLTIRRKSSGAFTAEISLYEADGTLLGTEKRTDGNCMSLVETAGRVVVPWLVPIVGPPSVPAPLVPPPPPLVVHLPEPFPMPPRPPVFAEVEPLPPPPRRYVQIHAGVSAVFNPFAAPGFLMGLAPTVEVRLPGPPVSFELDARLMGSHKGTVLSDGQTHRWSYASGALSASYHVRFFSFGPVLEAGSLTPRTDGGEVRGTVSRGFFALGLHGGLEHTFNDFLTLRASFDGEYVPLGASLDDAVPTFRLLWAMPAFTGTAVAGFTFRVR